MSDLPSRLDNLPPEPILPTAEEVAANLRYKHADLQERLDKIIVRTGTFEKKYGFGHGIPDDEVLGHAGDFAGRDSVISRFLQDVDATHRAEKAPWLAGSKAVDAWKSQLATTATQMRKVVTDAMNAYAIAAEERRRAEAARLAEIARQKAAEAEAAAMASMQQEAWDWAQKLAEGAAEVEKLATGSAADLTRVKSDLGTTVSLRTSWVFDPNGSDLMTLVKAVAAGQAPLEYLQFNATRIGYAVRSEKVRSIPGCLITEIKSV